ncbi:hypothetical protein IEQ34_002080 [Dendrobium chrysotoxum]|uniref:Uncharacterized protein n=1 Tax=Dendrobium chrysotoxum TaxID=161865 RepID=A0AAV7HMF9_DENCH|nr:hypothetical protein IEQ34_002080 [Dendrobium chrysotoxum]
MQSIDQIMQIIEEATIPAAGTLGLNQYLTGSLDLDDEDMDDFVSDPELDVDSNSVAWRWDFIWEFVRLLSARMGVADPVAY